MTAPDDRARLVVRFELGRWLVELDGLRLESAGSREPLLARARALVRETRRPVELEVWSRTGEVDQMALIGSRHPRGDW